MKKIIRYSILFAFGFFGAWALKQADISPKGEDGEMNWLVAVVMMVTFYVGAVLLSKPLMRLTGEIK